MSYEVKAEKTIARPPNEVFRALKEGRLFINCSADSGSMKIDFRVGGKYLIEFKTHKTSNTGEFLEIVPNKKIVFSWCQSFNTNPTPDTQVTVELFEDGPNTRLVLVHKGFKDEATRDNHQKGWNSGITDLAEEIQNGRLRMVREFKAPLDKIFETCKNPASFFAYMGDLSRGSVDFRVGGKYQLPTAKGEIKGEFLEILPSQKIKLSWLAGCAGPLNGSTVTLSFRKKDDNTSVIELIHDGLNTEDDQKAHRQGWETVTQKMSESLSTGTR